MDPRCPCGNYARYVNERGELTCALCPLKEGIDSLRISDVPALLKEVRRLVGYFDFPTLKEIIGRRL